MASRGIDKKKRHTPVYAGAEGPAAGVEAAEDDADEVAEDVFTVIYAGFVVVVLGLDGAVFAAGVHDLAGPVDDVADDVRLGLMVGFAAGFAGVFHFDCKEFAGRGGFAAAYCSAVQVFA